MADSTKIKRKYSKLPLLIFGAFFGIAAVFTYPLIPVMLTFILICLIFIALIFSNSLILKYIKRGAPYVSSTNLAIKTIIEFAEIIPGTKVVDLGSGDGKVVIQLARRGAFADGYEINPILTALSKIKAKISNNKNANFYTKNFWDVDLSKYDVVVVYGIKYIMGDLEEKLKKELRPGSRVISNSFEFPTLQQTKKKNRIFCYEV